PVLAAALLIMTGCGEEAESPTAPEPRPALAVSATAAPLSFKQVGGGSFHSCGVTTGNRAYCWGNNSLGQLGTGSNANSSTPVAVVGGLTLVQVSTGSVHSCGLTSD